MKYFYLVAIMAFLISCESPNFTGTFENEDSIFVIEDDLKFDHYTKVSGISEFDPELKIQGNLSRIGGDNYKMIFQTDKGERIDTCELIRTKNGIEIVSNGQKSDYRERKGTNIDS